MFAAGRILRQNRRLSSLPAGSLGVARPRRKEKRKFRCYLPFMWSALVMSFLGLAVIVAGSAMCVSGWYLGQFGDPAGASSKPLGQSNVTREPENPNHVEENLPTSDQVDQDITYTGEFGTNPDALSQMWTTEISRNVEILHHIDQVQADPQHDLVHTSQRLDNARQDSTASIHMTDNVDNWKQSRQEVEDQLTHVGVLAGVGRFIAENPRDVGLDVGNSRSFGGADRKPNHVEEDGEEEVPSAASVIGVAEQPIDAPPARGLAYAGPVVMSFGCFAVVFACVVVCETRDRVLETMDDRVRRGLPAKPPGGIDADFYTMVVEFRKRRVEKQRRRRKLLQRPDDLPPRGGTSSRPTTPTPLPSPAAVAVSTVDDFDDNNADDDDARPMLRSSDHELRTSVPSLRDHGSTENLAPSVGNDLSLRWCSNPSFFDASTVELRPVASTSSAVVLSSEAEHGGCLQRSETCDNPLRSAADNFASVDADQVPKKRLRESASSTCLSFPLLAPIAAKSPAVPYVPLQATVDRVLSQPHPPTIFVHTASVHAIADRSPELGAALPDTATLFDYSSKFRHSISNISSASGSEFATSSGAKLVDRKPHRCTVAAERRRRSANGQKSAAPVCKNIGVGESTDKNSGPDEPPPWGTNGFSGFNGFIEPPTAAASTAFEPGGGYQPRRMRSSSVCKHSGSAGDRREMHKDGGPLRKRLRGEQVQRRTLDSDAVVDTSSLATADSVSAVADSDDASQVAPNVGPAGAPDVPEPGRRSAGACRRLATVSPPSHADVEACLIGGSATADDGGEVAADRTSLSSTAVSGKTCGRGSKDCQHRQRRRRRRDRVRAAPSQPFADRKDSPTSSNAEGETLFHSVDELDNPTTSVPNHEDDPYQPQTVEAGESNHSDTSEVIWITADTRTAATSPSLVRRCSDSFLTSV